MALAVSRQLLSLKARARSPISLGEICGGQSGTGTGFPQSTSVLPCQYHSICSTY
jgi:hypothetical protein